MEEILEGKKDIDKERQAALERLNKSLDQEAKEEPPPSFLMHFAKRILSAEGFKQLKNRLHLEKSLGPAVRTLKIRSKLFSERLTIYMIIGAVAGARLGHILFYEKWSYYLTPPLMISKHGKEALPAKKMEL